jgi:hypothetical protein
VLCHLPSGVSLTNVSSFRMRPCLSAQLASAPPHGRWKPGMGLGTVRKHGLRTIHRRTRRCRRHSQHGTRSTRRNGGGGRLRLAAAVVTFSV